MAPLPPRASSTTQNRKSTGFRQVLEHTNKDQGYNTLVTAQLNKRFSNGFEFGAAYTWSETKDVYSLTSSIASSNFNFTALDGTLANRNLRTSGFDTPQKVTHQRLGRPSAELSLLGAVHSHRRPALWICRDPGRECGRGVRQRHALHPEQPQRDFSHQLADYDRLNTWLEERTAW
jgi:hypothetical protein